MTEGLIQKVERHHLSDYQGDFLYLGAAMNKLSDEDSTRLPDPSHSQIRGSVTEFCVLPLGSQPVWDPNPNPNPNPNPSPSPNPNPNP